MALVKEQRLSPVTHGLIGWLSAQPLESRRDRILVTSAALLPDLDGLSLVFGVEAYHKYHHTFGHNLLFGVLLSSLALLICHNKRLAALLTLFSFHTHLLGDLLGSGTGWGIPYLWPSQLLQLEFSPPFQWELSSWQNVLATVLCLAGVAFFAVTKDRTVFEIVSVESDKKVAAIFKKWLGHKKLSE